MALNRVTLDKAYPWCDAIVGPMFSGKTTELHRRLRELRYVPGASAIVITFEGDTRFSTSASTTHYKLQTRAIPCGKSLMEGFGDGPPLPPLFNVTHLFLEEAQFFTDSIEFIHCCLSHGICVTVAGLDSNALGEPWPYLAELVVISRNVIKLHARCRFCGNEAGYSANFTHHPRRWKLMKSKYDHGRNRLSGSGETFLAGPPVPEEASTRIPEIDIGGDDKYAPLCWTHFTEYKSGKPTRVRTRPCK